MASPRTLSIRTEEAASGQIPTPSIAVTANVMSHQVERYMAVGMNEVVSKPVEFRHLFSVMETCLSQDEPDGTAIAA